MIYPKAESEQEQYQERYELALERIQNISDELSHPSCPIPQIYRDYFRKVSGFILLVDQAYQEVHSGRLFCRSLQELSQQNLRKSGICHSGSGRTVWFSSVPSLHGASGKYFLRV